MPARPPRRRAEHADLPGGSNPYTVVRPRFITAPERVKDRVDERVGAQMGDVRNALLRVAGRRRRAPRWAWSTGHGLAAILVVVSSQPLNCRVHALYDIRDCREPSPCRNFLLLFAAALQDCAVFRFALMLPTA